MTIDWNTDTPPPPRPPAPEPRGRSRVARRRIPPVARVALAGVVAVTVSLAACGALVREVDRTPAGHPHVRPGDARRPTHPLPIRWGIDRLADPTAMVVDGDEAFVVEPNAVLAVAIGDGTTTWVADVKDADPYLAVDGDTVLVGAIDGFEALDRATGVSRWRSTIEDPYDRARTVGLVTTPHGTIAIGTTDRGGMVAIDAASGATVWEVTVDGTPHGPLVTDDASGLAAVRMERGGRVELHLLDAATGTERWSRSLGLMTGVPLIDGDRLVVDTGAVDGPGTVTAFDLRTGARVWATRVDGPAEADEGAIVDGSDVVVVDGLGTVTVLDRTSGRRRWSTELASPVFHGLPVVIDRVLVVRDIFGEFQVLDRRSGRLRGQFLATGGFVGVGAGPSGLVAARSGTVHHQIVGLPRAMTTMRAVDPARRAVTIGAGTRTSG